MPEIKPFYLDLSEREVEDIQHALGRILKSGQLILGQHTKDFEERFAKFLGKKYAVALNTGTSALEVLLIAHKAAGRRVAVQSNTNFATVAAIIRNGGIPVYMDMTAEYFAPNLDILRHTVERHGVSGVIWVHIGGVVAPDFPNVVDYCRSRGLFLIEDAAHAHGSELHGTKAGAFADGGAFSFFPTKTMTTMEGGMIVTDNKEHATLARSLRNQGKRDGDYGGLHYDLGSSWRISEIAAYIGLVQLSKLNEMLETRARAAKIMAAALDKIDVKYCSTQHMSRASNYKFIVRLPTKHTAESAKKALAAKGVVCGGGVYEIPCHLHPVFTSVSYNKEELKTTEYHCPRHICPPLTSGLSTSQMHQVASALEKVLS
jgi:dTDP-4-amino-4,6-dideoxygalactose transaminase